MNIFRSILNKAGIWQRLKYSFFGRIYLWMFKPGIRRQEERELEFYRSFLPACTMIFDIGANDGHKTIVFSKLANKVIACEPDPASVAVLQARFGSSRQVMIEAFAVTDHAGECTLHIEKPGSSLNTINPSWKKILEEDDLGRWPGEIRFSAGTITVPATTLDALIGKYGMPGFIKVDVEGNEKNVLKGLSKAVPCISFEVLLPEFLQDALDCMDMINSGAAGYLFNYAVEERLVLDRFIPHNNFRELISGLRIPHLEIIARSGAMALQPSS